ncbi:acetylornithine deacetylase [Phaeovulum sp. W22_SRMD_FR3]|uniref:acetylornithine deacetylase n=1 Tax=Phaeovulum sp. W22_SRMD_FR3 TaxID=3240274 RepID=UPI003F98420D
MTPERMLATLVGFRSVVGQPNGPVIDFIRDHLAAQGVESTVITGPEGDRANLFASIGPRDRPGYILSGHLDVVPAGEPEWRADPFTLRHEGDRLIGRGACDMKGFVAAVLSSVPALTARTLGAPIHIALSYDEEAGCKGVPHLIGQLPDLCAPPLGCIVGEPSGMQPVLRHKGKAALRVTARGVPGHSARPDLGANAIHALIPVLNAALAARDAAETGAQDPAFEPPYSTLQIGRIGGGQALNIIPDAAWLEIEARAISGTDPRGLLAQVEAIVAAQEALSLELLSSYPALALDDGHPLAALVAGLSGAAPGPAVSYGTEAGLFQAAGIPAIICGPGDMSRAHKPEEYLKVEELYAARDMVLALADHLSR